MDSIQDLYPSYQFVYAAFSYNQAAGSLAYMTGKYNFYGVPTSYYDGGNRISVGGYPGMAHYKGQIQAAGTRATHDLYLSISLDYISATELRIHYEVASRQNSAPAAASQPTTNCVMNPVGVNLAFTTQATEPDGDQIYYRFAYGNGDSSSWVGPYDSGVPCTINYVYPAAGTYDVKVLTKDPWLEGTVWSTPLSVEISDCWCGDANGDLVVDISDAVYLIQYIFAGGPAPGPCQCDGTGTANGDANGDSAVDISDAVYLIQYIFAGGPAPQCP